jgi:hypothetical protein
MLPTRRSGGGGGEVRACRHKPLATPGLTKNLVTGERLDSCHKL